MLRYDVFFYISIQQVKRQAVTRVAKQIGRVLPNYIILFQMGNPMAPLNKIYLFCYQNQHFVLFSV